jgi:hypothetical protein
VKPWEEIWRLDPKDPGVVLCPVMRGDRERDHILMAPLGGEPGDSRATLAACAPEMARMLLKCEWGTEGLCSECHAIGGGKETPPGVDKHEPDCPLDALLRKAGVR